MIWRQSVELALSNLGGTAPLPQLYEEVRRVRLAHGDTVPPSLKEVVRKELEYNSSDSTHWRGTRDLFFSVEGIGQGVWGLRGALPTEPTALDISLPEGAEAPGVATSIVNRIIRNTLMTRKVKALHGSRCQICGGSILLPDGSSYVEAHHIIPLGAPHNGPDRPSNIVVVCPNHHAMLDFGSIELGLDSIAKAPGHDIDPKCIEYHNAEIVGAARPHP